jgi:hypothetical protein
MKLSANKMLNWKGQVVIKIKITAKQGELRSSLFEDLLDAIQPPETLPPL